MEGEIFDAQMIERMENLILGALKWRMRSVTPFSFFSFFITFFELKEDPLILKHSLKSRATELTFNLQHGKEKENLKFSSITITIKCIGFV